MKFSIGNRVRVVNHRDYPAAYDKPAVIASTGSPGPFQYFVKFDDGKLGTGSFAEDDLELIAP